MWRCHVDTVHSNYMPVIRTRVKSGFDCPTCGKVIKRKVNLTRHQRTCSSSAITLMKRPCYWIPKSRLQQPNGETWSTKCGPLILDLIDLRMFTPNHPFV